MVKEIYDICITMLLDALEMFCSVLVVPTPKILRTAFLISLAILGLSFIGQNTTVYFFADWQECIVCTIMIAVLWGISIVNDSSIKKFHDKLSDIKTNVKKKGDANNG